MFDSEIGVRKWIGILYLSNEHINISFALLMIPPVIEVKRVSIPEPELLESLEAPERDFNCESPRWTLPN